MNKLIHRTALLALVAVLTPSAFADAQLDAVEKQLLEKWSKIKSVSMKITMSTDMQGMSTKGDGTLEYVKQGDKEMQRMDMNSEMSMAGGQKMASSSSMINDGEFTYTLSEMMGHKTAMKAKSDKTAGSLFGAEMFETLKKDNTVTAEADETVGTQKAWVIKAVPKAADQPGASTTKMYFAKDTGMLIQMFGLDQAGKTTMTMTYTDVKINASIDPARFVFKAPEGVTVMEMPTAP